MAPTLEEERLAADRALEAIKEAQEQQFARKEGQDAKADKIEVLEDIVQEQREEALRAASEANRALTDKKEEHKEETAFDYFKPKKKEEEEVVATSRHSYIRPLDEAKTTQDIQDDIERANKNCPGLFGDPLPEAEVSYADTSAVITLGENSVTISNDEHGQASYLCSAQDNQHIIEEAAARTVFMYNVTEMAQATSVDFLVSRSVIDSVTGEGSRAEAKNGLRDAAMAVTSAAMEKPTTVNGKEFNAGDQEFKDMRTELMAVKAKSAAMSHIAAKGHSGLKPTPTSAHKPVEPIPAAAPKPAEPAPQPEALAPKNVGQDIGDAGVKAKKDAVLGQMLEKGRSGLKPAPAKEKGRDSAHEDRPHSHEKSASASENTSTKEQAATEKPASPVVEKAREAIGAAKLQQDSAKQAETKVAEASTHSTPKAGGSH